MEIPGVSRLQRLRERVLAATGLASSHQAFLHHSEAAYHRTVVDTLRHAGIGVPLYPFGAAANASLLYLVTRAVLTLPISAICELGSGQTTILLNHLTAIRPNLEITTLEENEFWAMSIQAQVRHSIASVPLTTMKVRGRATRFYELARLPDRRYDFLVIDGPVGEPRFSRWGSLDLIDRCLADDFLIVFDDAERDGERDTCEEAIRLLQGKGIEIHVALVEAQKSQMTIASRGFRAACYF
jgi:hypothetical protein